MVRVYKYLYYVLFLLALLWVLPELYHLAFPNKRTVPFTQYSEVAQKFLYAKRDSVTGKFKHYDRAGRTYSERDFDSLLPSLYVRQLHAANRLPQTVQGVPVTKESLERNGFIFKAAPQKINVPAPPLYFLLESMPKRVDLEMPNDVFRANSAGVQFILMDSNSVVRPKTARFQKALAQKKVAFPLQRLANNPTTHKPYDSGCLVLDNNGNLFQLKQNAGQPFVRPIPLPQGVTPAYLFVTEFPSRKYLGFMTDTGGNLYAITLPGYEVVRTGLPAVNLAEESLTIFGNMFYWTAVIGRSDRTDIWALDANTLQAVDNMCYLAPKKKGWDSYLFPFQLSFTSTKHKFFRPQVQAFSWVGAVLWIGVIALFLGFRYRQCKYRSANK